MCSSVYPSPIRSPPSLSSSGSAAVVSTAGTPFFESKLEFDISAIGPFEDYQKQSFPISSMDHTIFQMGERSTDI